MVGVVWQAEGDDMGERGDREPSMEEILASIKRIIAEDGKDRPATKASPRPGARDDVLELTEDAALETEGDADAHDAGSAVPVDAPLIAGPTAASLRESLAALATLTEPGVPPQIVRAGETSLEQLTRDLMRPMLRQWLDANLPALVESLVAREIERITRR